MKNRPPKNPSLNGDGDTLAQRLSEFLKQLARFRIRRLEDFLK